MELPGEITTRGSLCSSVRFCKCFTSQSGPLPELIRGAYGPAPPIMPELEDEKPKEEEDEQQPGHQASLSFRQSTLAS